MLLETSEGKLLARGVAFEDVQFGLQVRNSVFMKTFEKDFTLCVLEARLWNVFLIKCCLHVKVTWLITWCGTVWQFPLTSNFHLLWKHRIDLIVLSVEKSHIILGFCMQFHGKTSICLQSPLISLSKLYRRLSYSRHLLSFNQCLITCRSFWCRKNHNQYGPRRLPVSTRYPFLHAGWRQHENRAQSKLKFHSRGPRGEYPPCQRSRQAVCRLRHDLSYSFYQPLCAGKILELFTFIFTPIFHLRLCDPILRNLLSRKVNPFLLNEKTTSCSSRVIKKWSCTT